MTLVGKTQVLRVANQSNENQGIQKNKGKPLQFFSFDCTGKLHSATCSLPWAADTDTFDTASQLSLSPIS